MRLVGSILLTVGFLAGAYVAVAQVDSVNWGWYAVCAGLMLGGMVSLRAARAAELEQAGDKHDADMAVLQTSLGALIEKVRGFESAKSDDTVAASNHSPMPIAPATAMAIRRFMSGRKERTAYQALGKTIQSPVATATE